MCKKAKQFKSYEDIMDRACGWGDVPEGFHECKDGSVVFVDSDGVIEDVTYPPVL